MAKKEYLTALLKEIDELKAENAALTTAVRPETLQMMKNTHPDAVLKREAILFTVKRAAIIAVIVLIAALVSLLAWSFVDEMKETLISDDSINDPAFVPDTEENFNKTGSNTAIEHLAVQNGCYYFAESGYIYKYVGNTRTEVLKANAKHINAYKYCLYYYDVDTEEICRVRTDGQDKRVLMTNVKAIDIKVYNNTVYILTEEGDIQSVYINGKKGYPVIEGENIVSFTVTGGYIYYIQDADSGLYLFRTKTSRTDKVTASSTDSPLLAANDNGIFYIHNGVLYSFSAAEEKAHAVFAGGVTEFAVTDDAILLLTDGTVYLTDKNGGNIKNTDIQAKTLCELDIMTMISLGDTDEK